MKCQLLTFDLLVRAMDHELSPAEMEWVPAHIVGCSECGHERESIANVSQNIEIVVNSAPVIEYPRDRAQWVSVKPLRQAPDRVMRRFGWGMAIAATLAIGIIMAPKPRSLPGERPRSEQPVAAVSNAIEVDGETFVALPYSNPDLPTSAPRIVQMQVPVSSLADIGLGLEQVTSEVSNQDRTVLADVLLGADGQPLGVHVVSWD